MCVKRKFLFQFKTFKRLKKLKPQIHLNLCCFLCQKFRFNRVILKSHEGGDGFPADPPVTPTLSVNSNSLNIDEMFMAIMLASTPPCSLGANAAWGAPRRLQTFLGVLAQRPVLVARVALNIYKALTRARSVSACYRFPTTTTTRQFPQRLA